MSILDIFKKKKMVSEPLRQYLRYVKQLKEYTDINRPALPPSLPPSLIWGGVSTDDMEEYFPLLEGMRALYNEQNRRIATRRKKLMNENKDTELEVSLPPEVGIVKRIATNIDARFRSDPEYRKQVFNAIMELYYARIYYERNYDRRDCDCDCGCKKEE